MIEIINNYSPLHIDTIRLYVHQILKGLYYLTKKKIMIKNLKGQNILIDINGIVKLTDWFFYNKYKKNTIIDYKEIKLNMFSSLANLILMMLQKKIEEINLNENLIDFLKVCFNNKKNNLKNINDLLKHKFIANT